MIRDDSEVQPGERVKDVHFTEDTLAGVESWKKLERALLLTFKKGFWSVPVGNKVGKNFKFKDEHKYFTERRLRTIIAELSQRLG